MDEELEPLCYFNEKSGAILGFTLGHSTKTDEKPERPTIASLNFKLFSLDINQKNPYSLTAVEL